MSRHLLSDECECALLCVMHSKQDGRVSKLATQQRCLKGSNSKKKKITLGLINSMGDSGLGFRGQDHHDDPNGNGWHGLWGKMCLGCGWAFLPA